MTVCPCPAPGQGHTRIRGPWMRRLLQVRCATASTVHPCSIPVIEAEHHGRGRRRRLPLRCISAPPSGGPRKGSGPWRCRYRSSA